jgi:soluble lytic murein transglycosylase-like protein
MRAIRGVLVAALLATDGGSAFAGASVCEREMARASAGSGVPLNVLYSVGLTETGRKGELAPYEMNVDGREVHSATLSEALARFAEAKARGARLIDVGCMQINAHFHGSRFASLAAMFDPAQNVDYAASFLKRLRVQEGSWTLAVARYNAGPDNPAAEKTYVCAVIRNMVASGFGRWTANARALCQPDLALDRRP